MSNVSAIFNAAPPIRLSAGVFVSFASFIAAFLASSAWWMTFGSRPMSRICLATVVPPDHTAIHFSNPCGRSGHRGLSRSDAPRSQDATPDTMLPSTAYVSSEVASVDGSSSDGVLGTPIPAKAAAASSSCSKSRSQLAASLLVSSTLCASSRITIAPLSSMSMADRTAGSRR